MNVMMAQKRQAAAGEALLRGSPGASPMQPQPLYHELTNGMAQPASIPPGMSFFPARGYALNGASYPQVRVQGQLSITGAQDLRASRQHAPTTWKRGCPGSKCKWGQSEQRWTRKDTGDKVKEGAGSSPVLSKTASCKTCAGEVDGSMS